MSQNKISYSDIPFYKAIIECYLNNDKRLRPFVYDFPSKSSISSFIQERKEFPVDRELLVSSIKSQYSSTQIDVPKNVNLLLDENTFTITTGHQLSLFGGPLFFIYKIIACIELTEKLNKQFPQHNFLPVFWMASEDHDFEEINSISFDNETFKWNTNQKGAVGRFVIDKSFIDLISKLEDKLSNKPFNSELFSLIKESYIKGDSLSLCTRRFVDKILSAPELIIIDGDDKALKSLFRPIANKECKENIVLNNVSKVDEELKKLSFHSQVHAREINLFTLEKESRDRIITEDISMLKDEEISPNALMRPIYQETILPNIAYIGGAGEIAYWLQLKSTFESFNTSFPALFVRNSFIISSQKINRILKGLDLDFITLFKPVDEVKKQFIKNHDTKDEMNFSNEINQLRSIFSDIKNKSLKTDKSLKDRVEAKFKDNYNFLKDLEKRLIRQEKKRNKIDMERIDFIHNELFPKGVFQERTRTCLETYAEFGSKFINDIYSLTDLYDASIKIVNL